MRKSPFEDDYPFFRNFHIKGLRGFKERMIGPTDSNGDFIGGNMLFCSKFSVYLPQFLPEEFKDVKTSIFFDLIISLFFINVLYFQIV